MYLPSASSRRNHAATRSSPWSRTQVTSANASGPIAVVGGNLIVAGFTTEMASLRGKHHDATDRRGIYREHPDRRRIADDNRDGAARTPPSPWRVEQTSAGGPAPRLRIWARPGQGAVARLAPDGGLTTLPNAPSIPTSFLFDGTDFFETVLCEGCGGGPLLRIPASGAPIVMMANGAYAAVDDTCVYYSTQSGIFSVVKTYGGDQLDAGVDSVE